MDTGLEDSVNIKSDTIEELLKLSTQQLVDKIVQLQAHNFQLKNIITKLNSSKTNTKNSKPGRPFDFNKFPKKHILLKFLYLGWDYQGFVVQEDTTATVEHHVMDALKKCKLIENRESANYHRCGRTDKGVSSFSQVISVTIRATADDKPELEYCKILNRVLPENIRMTAWCPVPDDFSARFNCSKRKYKYFFPKGNLDLKAMDEAAKYLIGTHDFRNICKMDVSNGVINYMRCIFSASVAELHRSVSTNEGYTICELNLEGQAFLWHQVRCIMTLLLLVGQGLESPSIIKDLLDIESNPRKPQYPIAHYLGLNLFSCEYENITWKHDKSEILCVMESLQKIWTLHAIQATHLICMLNELEKTTDVSVNEQYSGLIRKESRNYKSLLSRKTCSSLEERIEHYSKKRKKDI